MKKTKQIGTGKYEQLMETCRKLSPVTAAMVHPCEDSAITAAGEAAEAGLIQSILVGPADKLKKLARRLKLDLEPCTIVDVPHSHAAAAKAVELVREGAAEILMKGILSAVETVTSKIPSTIEAAVLCKMAERGQINGAIIDGPLAFDNAISKVGAKTKGIKSAVVGDVDILLASDLEAGNMLAKQLIFLVNADSAGLVLGARVPVVLNSRADSVRARLASVAVAVRLAHAQRM